MADKRLVLKSGFLVSDSEVQPCHFAQVEHKEEYYLKANDYIVLVGGVYSFYSETSNRVFGEKLNAEAVARGNSKKTDDFNRQQLAYYQEKLGMK